MVKHMVYTLLAMTVALSGVAYGGSETFISPDVASKQHENGSISTIPDQCLSPPSPPAGPVPIPYPNIPSGSDAATGAKKTKIDSKPSMTKGAGVSQSRGDESGVED
jgi:hypothetical protein